MTTTDWYPWTWKRKAGKNVRREKKKQRERENASVRAGVM